MLSISVLCGIAICDFFGVISKDYLKDNFRVYDFFLPLSYYNFNMLKL